MACGLLSTLCGKIKRSWKGNCWEATAQEYASVRRNEQEAAYNLGRAAHQLGLLHVAAPFYERALAVRSPDGAREHCVAREAAHNLALLYRATGARALARTVMRQHLVF